MTMNTGKSYKYSAYSNFNSIYGIIICTTLCYLCETSDTPAEPFVKTKSGFIVGSYTKILNKGVASFLGIPYAKPPVGDRRFKRPEPVEPWEGFLPTKEKPPACMQFSLRKYFWIPNNDLPKNEDCLYLNVWAPETTGFSKLPVMVWIHGGGYFAGSASMDIYDGSVLAVVGEVIVVSMNYRLGAFGFLNFGTDDVPGNAGLYDQLLALKWVNDNIDLFGGDPKQITIFGESVGSFSVHYLILSPLSRGLFQKAIMESGSTYTVSFIDNPNRAKLKSNLVSFLVGCFNFTSNFITDPSAVIYCMKTKDAEKIAHVEGLISSAISMFLCPCFGDNDLVPQAPITMIRSKNFQDVPLLIGNMHDESTTVFLNYLFPLIFPINKEPVISLVNAKKVIYSILPFLPKGSLDEIMNDVLDETGDDLIHIVSNIVSDAMFVCPDFYLAKEVSEAYFYWMPYRSAKNTHANWTGAEHATDTLYVFGRPFVDVGNFTEDDRLFSLHIMRIWAHFAHTGYPLYENSLQPWPKMVASNPQVYELNLKSEGVKPFPQRHTCEILKPFITNETLYYV